MFKNGVFLPLVYAKDDHGVWRLQERRDESDDEEELEDAWLRKELFMDGNHVSSTMFFWFALFALAVYRLPQMFAKCPTISKRVRRTSPSPSGDLGVRRRSVLHGGLPLQEAETP